MSRSYDSEEHCQFCIRVLRATATHQLGHETLAILHLLGELRVRLSRPLGLGLSALDLIEELLHLSLPALTLAYQQLELPHARSITLLVGHEQLDRLLLSLDEASIALCFGG